MLHGRRADKYFKAAARLNDKNEIIFLENSLGHTTLTRRICGCHPARIRHLKHTRQTAHRPGGPLLAIQIPISGLPLGVCPGLTVQKVVDGTPVRNGRNAVAALALRGYLQSSASASFRKSSVSQNFRSNLWIISFHLWLLL